jgi:PAS domain S-box-containing protein
VGFIIVSNRLGEQSRFNGEDMRLLHTLASQASAAIENARLESRLKASEQTAIRLGRILDESATEIYVLDAASLRIVQASRASLTRLGYTAQEMEAMTMLDLLREADAKRLVDQLRPLRKGSRNQIVFYGTHHPREGADYPIEARVLASHQDGQPVLVAIVQDISERVRADDAVRESQAKSRFLASMSHELRTPLNSVLGFAQLLLEPTSGELSDRQHRYITNITASGRHLLELINDVLDLSKIHADKMEVHCVDVALEILVEDCLMSLAPQASAKALDLSGEIEDNLYVHADPKRLRQVLLNLLSNAVKFTGPGGSVVVEGHRVETGVEVIVRDTGIGIPAADVDRMFEEFTQIDGGTHRSGEGTGLGLPLSRRLVELMKGSLTAESEVGVGSAFRVWLPGGELQPRAAASTGAEEIGPKTQIPSV